MATNKPMAENDAFFSFFIIIVFMGIFHILSNSKMNARFDALEDACGIEVVEGGGER